MERLKIYKEKRNFNKTVEPVGKVKKSDSKTHKFCVQYHEARAKHYDFRLEWKGVLISWAVPKGPSFNPKDKRLAVRVEDHPLDYASFEGTIPKGEYGGGTVMLWDEGTWSPIGDVDKGLKDGALKFSLNGSRLQGAWTLVRLKKEEGKENWLLIKEKDDKAKTTSGIPKINTSIATGRTIGEINSNKKLQKIKNPFSSVDPMLAKLETDIPSGKEFLFEIKYDGYRIVAFVEGGLVNLQTRNKQNYSQKFAPLTQSLSTFFASRSLVLDGEVVVTDESGRSDFGALQAYLKNPDDKNLVYMIFDILALDGVDLRKKPLLERKKLLKSLLRGAPSNLQLSQHVIGQGEQSYALAQKLSLEGIVGKRVNSTYSSARNGDWIKIKCYRRQEFVIGGWEKSTKKNGGIGALAVGYYDGGDLIYVGHVGTGIDEREAQELKALFAKHKATRSPFKNPPKNSDKLSHLKPDLVAEVQYAEITADNVLRQASFKGLRQDKSPREVVKEESESEVDGVKISSPERLIYPDKHITKIEVARYYSEVAERMLRYISGRLLSTVRCHESVENEKFFKKHPQKGAKNIKIMQIIGSDGEKDDYFYLTSKAGIISEVQSGTIEFHPWASKVKTLEKPDMMVFDLDPDEKMPLEKIRQGALDLRRMLATIGLKSFLKTSGGKGYHVVVPFAASVSWQEFHDFAKNVASLMEQKWPERYTTNIRKDARKGKIFIDWVRNARGATSVAPYSLRARKGAPVSMPIRWSELSLVAPNEIDIHSALFRLKKPDPWADFLQTKQRLKKKAK